MGGKNGRKVTRTYGALTLCTADQHGRHRTQIGCATAHCENVISRRGWAGDTKHWGRGSHKARMAQHALCARPLHRGAAAMSRLGSLASAAASARRLRREGPHGTRARRAMFKTDMIAWAVASIVIFGRQ